MPGFGGYPPRVWERPGLFSYWDFLAFPFRPRFRDTGRESEDTGHGFGTPILSEKSSQWKIHASRVGKIRNLWGALLQSVVIARIGNEGNYQNPELTKKKSRAGPVLLSNSLNESV